MIEGDVELCDRIERQRRVIDTQADVLVGLGFDLEDIAILSETSTPPAVSRGRVRMVLACGWVLPGPWWLADNAHWLVRLFV